MVRRQGENLHAIWVVLFLNVAFYFLEVQDPARYNAIFSFDRGLIAAGQVWRLFTYQFVQGSALSFFIGLLVLYIIGGSIEEELGTWNFVTVCVLSVLATAGVGALLNAHLIGSYVFSFSLLFIFATLAPDRVFYIFFIIPVKVKWLAWLALGYLVLTSFATASSIAALAGAAASYGYFWTLRRTPRRRVPDAFAPPQPVLETKADVAQRNRAQWETMRAALEGSSAGAVEQLAKSIEPHIVPGVNICPPVDFKPEDADGYCIRCEGFNECSVRRLRLHDAARQTT